MSKDKSLVFADKLCKTIIESLDKVDKSISHIAITKALCIIIDQCPSKDKEAHAEFSCVAIKNVVDKEDDDEVGWGPI